MCPDLDLVLRQVNLAKYYVEPLLPTAEGTVHAVFVPTSKALDTWHRLRQVAQGTGWWPVILSDGWECPMDAPERWKPSEAIVEDLPQVANRWLEEALKGRKDFIHRLSGSPWPAQPRPMRLWLFEPSQPATKRDWHIRVALVPTARCWEVPAWLKLGCWNNNPPPAVHVALLERWHEAFGAEIVTASNVGVAFRVECPPTSRESALALARELFLYCPELDHDDYLSVPELAAALLDSPIWSFWWD